MHEVKTAKRIEFSQVISIDSRCTIVTNGSVVLMEGPNMPPTPDVEMLSAVVEYYNKILDAIRFTKRQYNNYEHNHRTAEQKMRKHDYQGSSDLCCTQCGKTAEEGNHYKR